MTEEHKQRVMREDKIGEICIGTLVLVVAVCIGGYAFFKIVDPMAWYATMGVSGLFALIGAAVAVSGICS